MSPIIDIQRRLHEEGRIRIGHQVAMGNGKKRPAKLDKLRFTSQSEQAIRAIAQRYGGEPHVWEDAPVGHQFEVFTEASEIPVIVPPERMAFSLWYETWSAGGCKHRCDGEWDLAAEAPCACDPEARECEPHARLSVMLPDHPGSGLWRVDTSSFYASSELSGAFELAQVLVQATGRSVLAAKLRLQQRQVKRPDPENQGKVVTRNFPVVVLDFDYDIGSIALGRGTATELPEQAQRSTLTPIQADDSPAPSIEAQVAAVKNAEPKPPRANAQAALPPSGRRRGSAPKADEATGEITEVGDGITQAQANKVRLQLNHVGVREDKDVYETVGKWVGRKITSLKQVTTAELDKVLTEIGKMPEAVAS